MKEAGRFLWDLRTPMRDGVELSTDLYLPEAGLAGGPYPLVLLRTPDNNQQSGPVSLARHLSDNGYAVALQDVRGRHDSAGRFTPFQDEGNDGYDSIEWFAGQEWCNGKVGMMGAGYAGWVQWAAAAQSPAHLSTIVSTSPMSGPYRDGLLRLPMLAWLHKVAARVWQEGSQVDWDEVLWSLPLRAMDHGVGRELPIWQQWLDAPGDDPAHLDASGVDLPVLHITGWHDDEQAHALRLRADGHALLVGPWDDASNPRRAFGGVDFGDESVTDLLAVHLSWFDRWLKEAAIEEPQVRCFVTGQGKWRDLDVWPPATAPLAYHLRGGGRLTLEQPGEEPADSYDYDPANPVVATNDFLFFPTPPTRPVDPPLDRRFLERRDDVLVYTSEELTADLEVMGVPTARLFVGSDRPDTDWIVQLTDVSPSGASVLVAHGGVRGGSGEVSIELTSVAHLFRTGHRVRLSVTSSLFPFYSRNLNTGGDAAEETEPLVAHNEVRHDTARPSALTLPVVAADA
jgi:putative CocE/NonD family hydrolase